MPPKLLQEPQPQLSFAERTRQAVAELAPALKKYLRILQSNPALDSHSDSAMLTISSCGECAGLMQLLLASRGLDFEEYMKTDYMHIVLLSKAEPLVMVDANYLAFFLRQLRNDPAFLPADEILVLEGNNFPAVAETHHSLRKKFLENNLASFPGSEAAQKEHKRFEQFGETESAIFSRTWDAGEYVPHQAPTSKVLRLRASGDLVPGSYAPVLSALRQDGIL